MNTNPCARTLTYSRVLETDEEGCLAHLTSVFGCSEEQIVTEALQYVFRKLRANVPMSGSLLQSLENNEATCRTAYPRLASLLLMTEKAIADNVALIRAGESVFASNQVTVDSGRQPSAKAGK